MKPKGGATARRLGGRGPFEVDSFHAPPIGLMLNAEKFAGDRSPRPPPRGAAAHDETGCAEGKNYNKGMQVVMHLSLTVK